MLCPPGRFLRRSCPGPFEVCRIGAMLKLVSRWGGLAREARLGCLFSTRSFTVSGSSLHLRMWLDDRGEGLLIGCQRALILTFSQREKGREPTLILTFSQREKGREPTLILAFSQRGEGT